VGPAPLERAVLVVLVLAVLVLAALVRRRRPRVRHRRWLAVPRLPAVPVVLEVRRALVDRVGDEVVRVEARRPRTRRPI
jgi:hypothetical protein